MRKYKSNLHEFVALKQAKFQESAQDLARALQDFNDAQDKAHVATLGNDDIFEAFIWTDELEYLIK